MMSQANPSAPSEPKTTDDTAATLTLAEFLPYRLSVLANTVSRGLARLYSDRFDVTVPEWRVLAVLGSFGPMTANEAAARTAMDKVQVSRAVARLVAGGRLTRQEDTADRRRAVLDFTAGGRAVYQEIVPLALEREQSLLAGLSAADRVTLNGLIDKLLDRARATET
jgi:DNA-binding MarR family transcriptional regulator